MGIFVMQGALLWTLMGVASAHSEAPVVRVGINADNPII